jgi:hypothetical protein
MTLTDKLIPIYYWFKTGFSEVSLPIALFNFTTIIFVALTQRGIEITLIAIPLIGACIGIGVIVIGRFMERYEINSRLATHAIEKQNPVLKEMYEMLKKMEKE